MRMVAQTPAMEAGRIYVPKDAAWLQDYLHELAMFPKGKFDDQVDSTSQALAYVGMPSSADLWLEFMRQDVLRMYNLTVEDLTVRFDYTDPDAEFTVGSGRKVRRDDDGFYRVTEGEWSSIQGMTGVTRMDEA